MDNEFTRTKDTVTSAQGFKIRFKFGGGATYQDSRGEVYIDTEWLVSDPPGMILYKHDFSHNKFKGLDQSRIDKIFSDLERAVQFLGYRVEIWTPK